MKTKIYLLLIAFILMFNLNKAQTITSNTNGNWMNPLIWSCFCVPVLGYNATSITINHNVALDTSMAVNSGTLTVSSSGSLVGNNSTRDLLINGGTFTNSGTTDIRYLLAQTGSFTNNGTLHITAFSNNVNFGNYGSIINADSITNYGSFTNYPGSVLQVDSLSNFGTFINSGVETHTAFTNFATFTNNNYIGFYDFTNFGTFINSDSLIGSNDFFNTGVFTNQANGVLTLSNSFLNADSLNHYAVFVNEGKVTVGNNWYNSDTVKGVSGSFSVQNLSGNSGFMKGSFDFCDLTPPANAPFIDYIAGGSISSNITWCTATSFKSVAQNLEFAVFPNPAGNSLNIKTEELFFMVEIINATGEKIYSGNNSLQIDLSQLSSGMYIFIAKDSSGNISHRQRFIKE